MSIVVRTLSEQVFDVVREQIVTGKLPQERPIRQDALATELGVSKIPLREALGRLEQEGLLSSQANRGFFVRAMTADEAEEIFALRLAIEPGAAARAANVASDADHQAARRSMEELDEAAGNRRGEVAALNRAFHLALIRPLKRVLTAQLIERLHFLSERYVYAHLEPAGRGDRAHQEHSTLLDAWCARDGETVKGLLTSHIQATLDDLRGQDLRR